jgi:hypothetical protein
MLGNSMDDQIVNKVVNSGLITFNLEDYHQPGERVVIDIRHQLFQELILKEKDFRDFIKQHDWSQYRDKYVAITCTADAIVPQWAFMLVAIALSPVAKFFVFGTLEELEIEIFRRTLAKVDWSQYENTKVVVKGCSKVWVPAAIYIDVTRALQPFASSLMFGEPCSTVPLYKKPKR